MHHPALHLASDNELYVHPSGVSMVVMDYIDGDTYFDIDSIPTDDELKLIVAEAVKIHNLDLRPSFLFDSWAIPHIHKMFYLTSEYLGDEGTELTQKAIAKYDAIDKPKLTNCFVHGDIISTNTLKGVNGKIWILDFAVANIYPKVQELAVICSSLLARRLNPTPLIERVEKVKNAYREAGGILSNYEESVLFDYALAGIAMEFMGGYKAGVIDNEDQQEAEHWKELGLNGLREALKNNK